MRSPEVKKLARAHPALAHEVTVGPYEIYGVHGNDGHYAIPLTVAPVLVRPDGGLGRWKEIAYQWFKRSGPEDPVIVFGPDAPADEEWQFACLYEDLPRDPPRRVLCAPPRPHWSF